MKEYRLKITGVHYAANPDSVAGQADTEEMHARTRKMLPNIDHADFEKLKTYVNIWLKNSRHDLSREARQARSAYIERLLAAQNKEVRQLAEPLKRQRTSICGRAMLNERCQQWWPSLMATERVERLWNQWRLRNDNKLWYGLRWIDSLLKALPGELYHDIGKLDELLSSLYYLNTPQKAFQSILALMILRELTCRELGIEMRPMAEAEYQQDGLITDPMEMPTTIGRVVEFGKTQCELPIQRQTIQMLAQWLRDDYEQSHSKEIETLAEDRQEMLAKAIEKVAEKPATVISHVENYQPQIQNQNIDLPAPPLGTQETKRLYNE